MTLRCRDDIKEPKDTVLNPPVLLVVMGVSGCGKSTFSRAIGDVMGLEFTDGDDFHAPDSVAKMQAGIALDDADRWPWLDRIAAYVAAGVGTSIGEVREGEVGAGALGRVVACSALKRSYRDRIRSTAPNVKFIFLDGNSDLIRKRMNSRTGHFMNIELLDDQLRTLQRPAQDEVDVITLDVAQPVEQMVAKAQTALRCR